MGQPDTSNRSHRLLLFGATGFAGRHLRSAAEAAGVEVIGASRARDADLVVDVLDRSAVHAAVREAGAGLVANLAGAASVAQSWKSPAATFMVNTVGAVNVLDAVSSIDSEARLLCVSSGEAYGRGDGSPMSEETPLTPLSPYGASKAAMEAAAGQYARARELQIIVARPFNHLGPGQSDVFVASGFARQVAEAESKNLPTARLAVGNLAVARDFTDVRDVAKAYVLLLQGKNAGTFNVCTGKAVPLSALVEALANAAKVKIETEVDQGRLRRVEADSLSGAPERLQKAVGWRPEIPLQRTVDDLLGWWRARLQQEVAVA